MFLLYRNQGQRRFGAERVAPYVRKAWEFQFFIKGRCTFVLQESGVTREELVIGPVLYVSGPDNVHGWSGKPSDVCEVIVFHFDDADLTIRTMLGPAGFRKLRFSKDEIPALQALYDRCNEARQKIGWSGPEVKKRAGFFEPVIYNIVAEELTLFFLKHIPKAELGPTPNYEENKVVEALAWYEANLNRGPSIQDISQAIHISTTHLRHLFHRSRGMSPQTAFTMIQFKRAKWLMRDFSMTLDQIANAAGFGSASAFSRAFKKQFGVTPKSYREKWPK